MKPLSRDYLLCNRIEIITNFTFISFLLDDFFGFATLHRSQVQLSHDLTAVDASRSHADIDNSFGYPTSLCYCEFSMNIFVGFSGGAIQRYSAADSNIDPKSRILPLNFDTATVHASSIKKMLPLKLRQPVTSRTQQLQPQRELLAILVCDESGIISLWRINLNENHRWHEL